MGIKKWLCALLTLVMLLSLLPVNAMAVEYVELSGVDSSDLILSDANTYVGPALAEGNHERWIDRLANLPDFAAEFYAWLEANATADGALADPTKGEATDSGYIYMLETVNASVDFTYTDSSDKQACAVAAVQDAISAVYPVIRTYGFEVYGIFDRDHPEVFWLDGRSQCGYTAGLSYGGSNGTGVADYTLNVYFSLQSDSFDVRAEAYRDTAAISSAIAQRDSDIQRILADCPTDASTAEQVRYLNRVLTQTNAYNSAVAAGNSSAAAESAWECTSALGGNSGVNGPVCEGYARAFKVLCDELDIPCVLVEGDAKASASDMGGGHMWNYVQVGGSWYAVDATWNDPLVGSTDNPIVSGYESEEWLLLGSETLVDTKWTFIQSHPVSNGVLSNGMSYPNGPVLSASEYVEPDNYMDVAPYRSGEVYTAPVREGKVFAGWYMDEAMTQPMGKNVTEGYAYAKFLDEQILTVKCQISGGTTAQSASTNLRMLTGIDSLAYSEVSFHLSFGTNAWSLASSTVYDKIIAGGVTIENPAQVFGDEAQFFVTYFLTNVPQSMFNTDMTVSASWETLDGTVVDGASRTFQISQAFG